MAVHFRSDGTLLVAGDPSDRMAIDRVLGFHQAIGLPAVRLGAQSCREAEPMLAPGISGGVDLPDDRQVDNRAVVTALLEACRVDGVTTVSDRVVRVDVGARPDDGLRVQGVTLEIGDALAATSVVISAGSRSGEIAGLPEEWRPPVRPVHGVTVRMLARHGVPRLRRTVRALVHGRSCYLVPRDDEGLVLGATVEEHGAALDVPLGGLADLIADARRIVPALDEYSVLELAPGLRPGSLDNGPIVGTTPVHGLLVATGHYRNGILLAPATADEVVALLDTRDGRTVAGSSPFDAFRPIRFTERKPRGDHQDHSQRQTLRSRQRYHGGHTGRSVVPVSSRGGGRRQRRGGAEEHLGVGRSSTRRCRRDRVGGGRRLSNVSAGAAPGVPWLAMTDAALTDPFMVAGSNVGSRLLVGTGGMTSPGVVGRRAAGLGHLAGHRGRA